MSERLYVVVRADLPIGLQLAQAAHAAVQFERCCPELQHENLVVLHVPDEDALDALCNRLGALGAGEWTCFLEPDLGNAPTALAADGTAAVKKLVRHLPLAFAMSSRDSLGATAHSAGTCTATGGASS